MRPFPHGGNHRNTFLGRGRDQEHWRNRRFLQPKMEMLFPRRHRMFCFDTTCRVKVGKISSVCQNPTWVDSRWETFPFAAKKFFLTITAFDYLCKGTSAWSVEGGFSSFPCLMTSWARPRWGNVCFPEEHKRLIVRINDMNQLVSSRSPPWGKDNVSVRKRRKTWGVWWNNRSKRAERHAEMDPDAPLGSIKWWWRSCLLPNIDSWVNVTLESWAHQMMQLRDKEVCKSMQGTIGSIDWLQVGHPARWKPAFDL